MIAIGEVDKVISLINARKATCRETEAYYQAVARPAWKRFDATKDQDIRRAVASDPESAPILDAEWFRHAKVVLPELKQAVSLRLDRDIMEWFKRR